MANQPLSRFCGNHDDLTSDRHYQSDRHDNHDRHDRSDRSDRHDLGTVNSRHDGDALNRGRDRDRDHNAVTMSSPGDAGSVRLPAPPVDPRPGHHAPAHPSSTGPDHMSVTSPTYTPPHFNGFSGFDLPCSSVQSAASSMGGSTPCSEMKGEGGAIVDKFIRILGWDKQLEELRKEVEIEVAYEKRREVLEASVSEYPSAADFNMRRGKPRSARQEINEKTGEIERRMKGAILAFAQETAGLVLAEVANDIGARIQAMVDDKVKEGIATALSKPATMSPDTAEQFKDFNERLKQVEADNKRLVRGMDELQSNSQQAKQQAEQLIESLQQEVRDLKETSTSECKTLQTELQNHSDQVADLVTCIKDVAPGFLALEKSSLQADLVEQTSPTSPAKLFKSMADIVKSKIVSLSTVTDTLQQNQEATEDRINTVQKSFEANREQQKSTTTALQSAIASVKTSLQTDLEQQKSTTTALQSAIDSVKTSLQTDREEQKSTTTALQSAIDSVKTSLEADREQQKLTVAALQSAIASTVAALQSAIASTVAALQSAIDSVKTSLQTDREQQKSTVAALQSAIASVKTSLQTDREQQKSTVAALQSAIDSVKTSLQTDLEQQKSTAAALQSAIASVKTSLQTDREQQKSTVAALQSAIASVKTSLQTDREQQKSTTTALQSAIASVKKSLEAESIQRKSTVAALYEAVDFVRKSVEAGREQQKSTADDVALLRTASEAEIGAVSGLAGQAMSVAAEAAEAAKAAHIDCDALRHDNALLNERQCHMETNVERTSARVEQKSSAFATSLATELAALDRRIANIENAVWNVESQRTGSASFAICVGRTGVVGQVAPDCPMSPVAGPDPTGHPNTAGAVQAEQSEQAEQAEQSMQLVHVSRPVRVSSPARSALPENRLTAIVQNELSKIRDDTHAAAFRANAAHFAANTCATDIHNYDEKLHALERAVARYKDDVDGQMSALSIVCKSLSQRYDTLTTEALTDSMLCTMLTLLPSWDVPDLRCGLNDLRTRMANVEDKMYGLSPNTPDDTSGDTTDYASGDTTGDTTDDASDDTTDDASDDGSDNTPLAVLHAKRRRDTNPVTSPNKRRHVGGSAAFAGPSRQPPNPDTA